MGKPEAPTPVDADHISICKISKQDREEGVVYGSILLFLEDYLMGTNSGQPGLSPGDTSPVIDRIVLYGQLAALPPPQFGQVVFTLNPPPGTVPDSMAAQGARVEALLNWAQGTGGCGLAKVNAVLQSLLNRPR